MRYALSQAGGRGKGAVVSPTSAPPRSIASPCVKVCIVDGASGQCLGCYRSLREIAAWQRYDDAERATIMAELPGRAARMGLMGPTG